MNSEGHYLVVISVANCSDRHYNLPQISLPGSDLHYSFFTVIHLVVLRRNLTIAQNYKPHNH